METSTRRLALVLAAFSAFPLSALADAHPVGETGAASQPSGQPAGLFINGVVDQFRIDPHGRVSGLVLRDGTELVAPDPNAAALTSMVHPGDRIRTPYGPSGTLEVENLRSNQFVQIGTIDQVARGGGPTSIGPVQAYAPVDDASKLETLAVSGRIRTMLRVPNGAPAGFVMEDGTQVHIVPTVAGAVAEQVSPGDQVRVEGRGTRTPMGVGMWGLIITRPNNLVTLDMTRGIGAPELNLR